MSSSYVEFWDGGTVTEKLVEWVTTSSEADAKNSGSWGSPPMWVSRKVGFSWDPIQSNVITPRFLHLSAQSYPTPTPLHQYSRVSVGCTTSYGRSWTAGGLLKLRRILSPCPGVRPTLCNASTQTCMNKYLAKVQMDLCWQIVTHGSNWQRFHRTKGCVSEDMKWSLNLQGTGKWGQMHRAKRMARDGKQQEESEQRDAGSKKHLGRNLPILSWTAHFYSHTSTAISSICWAFYSQVIWH